MKFTFCDNGPAQFTFFLVIQGTSNIIVTSVISFIVILIFWKWTEEMHQKNHLEKVRYVFVKLAVVSVTFFQYVTLCVNKSLS